MSELRNETNPGKLEEGITESILRIHNGPQLINQLMRPGFVACSETEKWITIEFPVQEWQLNAKQVMHGGMISTACDLTMGMFAAFLNDHKPVVTVNLSINFTKPVPMNDAILITAKATSIGKRMLTFTADCHLKSNALLTCTAIGTFAVVDLNQYKSNF